MKGNDNTQNAVVFDQFRLPNIHVTLNAQRYSAVVKQCQVSRVYKEYIYFRKKFIHMDYLVRKSNNNPSAFKDI